MATIKRFENLQRAGRDLTAEERRDQVQLLGRDPRFAAVLGVIETMKDEISAEGCELKYAGNAGYLAHAAGARSGLQMLEARLRGMIDAPRKTGEQRTE